MAELIEFLRMPSISALSQHKADLEQTAAWLAAHLEGIGLTNAQVMPTGGHPVVYAQHLAAGPDAPTILVYGHYDVQPVDPLDQWISPPFNPDVRDGFIYARGAVDDKGQVFAQIKALEALLAVSALKCNVKVLIEGEEEIGSANLDAFIRQHQSMLAADSVLISDTDMLGPDQPMITYGLRGLAYCEFRIKGPRTDLHSGMYGGTVHNPAQVVAEVLAGLHHPDGSVAIPGFYDDVRPLSAQEREMMAQAPYTLAMWQAETGLKVPWGEADYSLLERMGARPTAEINGMWGGFAGEGAKTIIPAEAGAKISMRLVPDQDPDKAADLLEAYIRARVPADFEVQFLRHGGGWPVIAPLDSPQIEAASAAYEDIWGRRPVFGRSGGSIPVVATFQQMLGAPSVLMGFGLPGDNLHAPNERFALSQYFKGIQAVVRFYERAGR